MLGVYSEGALGTESTLLCKVGAQVHFNALTITKQFRLKLNLTKVTIV